MPEGIDYRELPASAGFSRLFLDYLYDYEQVSPFFPADFRDPGGIASLFDSVRTRTVSRSSLSAILEKQNTQFGSGAKALENARRLRDESSYAVVTGQQVGLFGGPLYTIYKILTCLQLADSLSSRHAGMNFVPVFWLEGEDHDFEEIRGISVLDRSGSPVRVEYPRDARLQGKNTGPVGEMLLGEGMQETMKALEAALIPTEFTAGLLEAVSSDYSEEKTFLDAFVRWTVRQFGDSGLVFLNPNDPDLKRLAAPLFEREVREYPATSQLVVRQSAELEDRYHAQVKPKSINLFLLHRGGRYLIEPREHDFSLKGTRHYISKDEMSALLKDHPDEFSPNVVLRPIVQDFLLPTVAYVAGPAEVAYQAQLRPVYERFGVTQPVIYPRASASFVEERAERVMSKYQIPVLQLFEDAETVTTRILRQVDGVNIDGLFRHADEALESLLNELKFGLSEIDPTLEGPLAGTKGKIEQALRTLHEKSLAAQKRRNETAVRQIERATGTMMPGGALQERGLNLLYYMNKYGPETIRWLSGEISSTLFTHQLLTF